MKTNWRFAWHSSSPLLIFVTNILVLNDGAILVNWSASNIYNVAVFSFCLDPHCSDRSRWSPSTRYCLCLQWMISSSSDRTATNNQNKWTLYTASAVGWIDWQSKWKFRLIVYRKHKKNVYLRKGRKIHFSSSSSRYNRDYTSTQKKTEWI